MTSAAFGPEWLSARLAELVPAFPDVSLCVALSGGVDSVTLLAALAALRSAPVSASGSRVSRTKRAARSSVSDVAPTTNFRLRAVHVHHGLHPNADTWAAHCEALAKERRVPLTVLRVTVDRARGASLEAAARDARYQALEKVLQPGEVLLTAHHQDDQLETVFLQLLRGAGVAGLAAMPAAASFAAGQLVRPLLACSRAELETWARTHALTWIDDDSNANEQLDRNYLRRTVLPLIRERWPGAAAAVTRSARHAAEAQQLLDALALADLERAAVGAALSVQRLRGLDLSRRRNVLRFWICRAGRRVPDARRLGELAGALLEARQDANPFIEWNGTRVERHADVLTLGAPPLVRRQPVTSASWEWNAQPSLILDTPAGELSIVRDTHGPLDLDSLAPVLNVRRRQGGETLRPHAKARSRKLKSLLQEARIPLADRDRLPLIYVADKLIAVGDRWLDASARAAPGAVRRGRIRWQPK